MASYVRECNRCRKPIEMSDKSSRWLPYNENGSRHFCSKDSRSQAK